MLSVDEIIGSRQDGASPSRVDRPLGSSVFAVLHCLAAGREPVLAREPLPPNGWHAARHPDWKSMTALQKMRDGFSSYYSVRFDPKMCIFL